MSEFIAIFEAIGAWWQVLTLFQKMLVVAVLLFWFFVNTWESYVSGMHFKIVRDRGELYPVGYGLASLCVSRTLLQDALFNQIFGFLFFFEIPFYHLLKDGEILFTQRLQRHKAGKPGTYRWWMANWFCTRMLDQFEKPGEKHC